MRPVLLFFVDGVGLGDDNGAANPFVTARLPTLRGLLDGHALTRAGVPHHGTGATLVGLDATLGHGGIPQSGTGQAALLTGRDTVAMHGRHFGPWVPSRLRDLVLRESVLARAADAGHRVAFANAYPEEVLASLHGIGITLPSDVPGRTTRAGRMPPFLRAGPPLAALGAGLLTRHTEALERGDAVASELTNESWRERLGRTSLPRIDTVEAGRNLARIALAHQLTLFAHYSTDYAGHAQDLAAGVLALERLDSFLHGIIAESGESLLIFVVSDHGNLEDVRAGHTRNPAFGLVIGDGHQLIARRLHSLTDVTPVILDMLAP